MLPPPFFNLPYLVTYLYIVQSELHIGLYSGRAEDKRHVQTFEGPSQA